MEPPERFELSTPGLQDQCSNPWATEATWVDAVDFYYLSFAILPRQRELHASEAKNGSPW